MTYTAILQSAEPLSPPHFEFSYSRPEQRFLSRAAIRLVERFTGQPKLRRLYQSWSANRDANDNLFAAATRLLNLDIQLDGKALSQVPKTGPLLIIANHPYGVLDGIAIGSIATSIRDDVKIMTHSLLCRPPEIARYMLPVDFGDSVGARQTSASTRRNAKQWLKDGHCVVMFPSGSVATSLRPVFGKALEPAWHPFTAKLATLPKVRVLPIYFHGQNSRLFQMASHIHYACRLSLLFHETVRRMGTTLHATIGDVLKLDEDTSDKDRILAKLRKRTLSLGGPGAPDPTLEFKWPKHIRFN